MRIITRVAAIALVLFALVPAVAAGAQTCATAPYCSPDTPDVGGEDDGAGGGVLPTDEETSGGAPVGQGPDAEAVTQAPSGGLPITGGDVAGMAAIGAVAIGLGALLVRRSKTAKHPA